MRSFLRNLVAVVLLTVPAWGQEAGLWRAESQTARSITGDIGFSSDRVTINFFLFTIAKIRPLTADEIATAFNPDPGTHGVANLYRVDIPATRKFLKKNTLCGSDDTTWMATFVNGRTLEVDFFSGAKPPAFGPDLSSSADLCGTFTYMR